MDERAIRGVVIDAGHGGSDPGAVSGSLQEKDFTLKASLYMYDRLRELGIPVALTRDSDVTLSRTERVNKAMNAFGSHPDVILVSNHINAGGGEGAEIFYALRNRDTLARTALENIGQAGQIMRRYYQRRLPENPMQDYYFIIRDTNPLESILVEYGFIDNENDRIKLQNKLLDYVEGVVKAIATYTNTPYTSPTGENSNDYYTVQEKDSLWSIASKYNTTVEAIKELNNLQSNSLSEGQVLKVPTTSLGKNPPDQDHYIVQPEDNLWELAKRFNVSVDQIKEWNNLTSDALSVGQTLIIAESSESDPEITPSTRDELVYTVQAEDSLLSITNRHNTTVNEIISLNNLSSNVLSTGQQLRIPNINNEPDTTPILEYDIYEVVSGDSLWKIATRYGITVEELLHLNNLTSKTLTIGQQLKVPRTGFTNTYVVQIGDSLWNIARRFDITVDQLKQLNGLTNNTLQIGKVLIIS